MTFGDGMTAFLQAKRSRPGWLADPQLRKGYLLALPIVVLGMLFAAYVPVGLVAALVWFAVAARSRARG